MLRARGAMRVGLDSSYFARGTRMSTPHQQEITTWGGEVNKNDDMTSTAGTAR
jgi:hypothetical protein